MVSSLSIDTIMSDTIVQYVGSALFGLAVIHTFLVKKFEHIAHKFPAGSPTSELFHFFGEVEAVFGLWAAALILFLGVYFGGSIAPITYLESQNFTEPAFVFVIMAMAATRPVIKFAEQIIEKVKAVLGEK